MLRNDVSGAHRITGAGRIRPRAVVGALFAAAMLAACGDSRTPTSVVSESDERPTTTTTTTSSTTTTTAPPTPDETFWKAVSKADLVPPSARHISDADTRRATIQAGHDACREGREGVPQYGRSARELLVETWEVLMKPTNDSARFMRLAAKHLCPDVAATIAELEADPSATTTTLPPGITYEVLGSGTALITYSLGRFDQAQETATLPWRKDFNFMEVPESRQVLAQLQGSGEITCRILRGDEVLKEVRSNGDYVIAHCGP